MRLKSADTCPNNGSRENCPCVKDQSPRVGMTAWRKINLNVTSMSINPYDFTFTRQLHGMVVPYGESGDCYSMANCPRGEVQHQPKWDRATRGSLLWVDRSRK